MHCWCQQQRRRAQVAAWVAASAVLSCFLLLDALQV
jgi:hypothetical protein